MPAVIPSLAEPGIQRRLSAARIRLRLASHTEPATAWTVEGEIRGTEHPDQIVQVGGHLDSWDPGTGSIDDGAGYISVGTTSWLSCHIPFKKCNLIRSIATMPSAIPGRNIVVAEQGAAGRCLP